MKGGAYLLAPGPEGVKGGFVREGEGSRGRKSKNFPGSRFWWKLTFWIKTGCFYGVMLRENIVNLNFERKRKT